jgi:hypothetical protein
MACSMSAAPCSRRRCSNAAWLSSDQNKPVALPISRAAYDRFLAKKIKTSTFVKNAPKKK